MQQPRVVDLGMVAPVMCAQCLAGKPHTITDRPGQIEFRCTVCGTITALIDATEEQRGPQT